MKPKVTTAAKTKNRALLHTLGTTLVGLALTLLPQVSWGWTNPACSCGFSDGQFTLATIPFNGLDSQAPYDSEAPAAGNDWSAWQAILADPDNVSCDGGHDVTLGYIPPQPDRDIASIGTTGRDLLLFAYTWDADYVYALTGRVASKTAQQSFVYYADKNNNGLMESGESAIVAKWNGSAVDISLGTYRATTSGGDSLVDTSGYGDGYRLPGSLENVQAVVSNSTAWAGWNGLYMQWRISWSALGISPDSPFSFHVSSSNCTPGSGGFPACVEDNMGGCGGRAASTQYANLSFTPDRTLQPAPGATDYAAHLLTNTGNGADSFVLSTAAASGFTPTVRYYHDVNGNGAYDAGTDTPLASDANGSPYTGSLAAGAGINLLVAYTLPAGTSGNATLVTTASSSFQPLAGQTVTDTINVLPYFSKLDKALGGSLRIAAADQFTVQIKNGATVVNSTTSSTTTGSNANTPPIDPGTGSTGRTVLTPGVSYLLTEQMAAASSSPVGSYDTSISCSNGYPGSSTVLPAGAGQSFSITPALGDNISCTLTNTPKQASVTLQKNISSRVAPNDQFTLTVSDGTTLSSASTAGSALGLQGVSAAKTVPTGTPLTLSEAMAGGSSGSLDHYGKTIDCSNTLAGSPTVLPSGSVSGFPVLITPVAGDVITCTITNALLPPNLTVVKYANRVSAKPGEEITYTVVVTNTGPGPTSQVIIQDRLSPYVSWKLNSLQLSQGTPASGMTLTFPPAALFYSFDNGPWVRTAPGSGAPAGYDGSVTAFKIDLSAAGTMNANNAAFTINYQAQVK